MLVSNLRLVLRPVFHAVSLLAIQACFAQTIERIPVDSGSVLKRISPDGKSAVGSAKMQRLVGSETLLVDWPIVWSREQGVELLPVPPGYDGGAAYDLSTAGNTIAGWVGPWHDQWGQPQGYSLCVWDNHIASLGLDGVNLPVDLRVSSQGTVLAMDYTVWSRPSVSSPWTQANLVGLNGYVGTVHDISADGMTLVGRSHFAAYRWHGPQWTPEPLDVDHTQDEERLTAALGVSPDGRVAVGQDGPSIDFDLGSNFAWWNDATRQPDISSIGEPAFLTTNDGMEILTQGAGIYTPSTGMNSLYNYLREQGVQNVPPINRVLDMSEDGSVILAKYDDGNFWDDQYYLVTIPPAQSLPKLKIKFAKMVAWNKLRVEVERLWGSAPGSYTLNCTINGTRIHKVQAEQGDPTYEDIDVDLTRDGTDPSTGAPKVVPRFTSPQRFTVAVSATVNGVTSAPEGRDVFIPLPVVIVQGFFTTDLTDGVPQELVDLLKRQGYEEDGPSDNDYPTLVVLGDQFRYKPTFDTLAENAQKLQRAIYTYSFAPKTYANKVDIVTHSKGGLVARMYLKNYDPQGQTVRRLVICCAPQTGSTLVSDSPISTRVLRELGPTWAWYRTKNTKPFEIPGQWKNRALQDLNSWAMPRAVDYYLLYGAGINTKVNLTVTPIASTYQFADGDGVVPAWSQLGYQIENDSKGRAWQGGRVSAFAGQAPIEVPIAHGHYGFLDAARDVIEWALAR